MTTEQPVILLTTDFSKEATRAYGPAVELARRLGGMILFVHVVEVTAVAPHGAPLAPVQLPPDTNRLVAEARERMAAEVLRLGDAVAVETVVEAAADVVDHIVRMARDRGVDMIAISTHGRTGIRRLVLGSVAEETVRKASVPVLTFPAQ